MSDKSTTGSYQVVVQGETDTLTYRLQDPSTGVDKTMESGLIQILGVGGDEKVATTPATVSGAVASYTHAFTEAAGWIRDLGYRALWTLVSGGVTYHRETYFQIVRRRFVSQLTDADMTAAHPYLSAQLPGGMAPHRLKAWAEIERRCYAKARRYPGNIFFPERFIEAHEWLTLANAFFALSFDGSASSEDWVKYNEARNRGLDALSAALEMVDFDDNDDGQLQPRELRQNFRMVNVRR